jgi:NosR/NirI family nitrous oxide reductase transcriptional regulator
LLVVFWAFIAITTLIWGRGVFCGWACPYGSLNELLFKIGEKLKLPHFELPERIHKPLRWLRYVVFVVLVITFFFDPVLGEKMAEIEPFKSTFYVPAWTRPIGFFVWWAALLVLSVFWFRPFCRYLCPMGAALAIPSSLRLSGPYRREFCTQCKICPRQCEPRAIRSDGTIDSRECLSCMECEANYRDDQVCPTLITIHRIAGRKAARGTEEITP